MTGPGPGTAALDAHVDAADGGPPQHRWTPRPAHSRSGPPPLAEVTAHRVGAPAHWHLVTYGLSELDEPEEAELAVPEPDEDDEALSGWGFELTLRVPDTGEEPLWAVELLTNLAAYVWSSGHPFAAGHHLDLRGPMRIGEQTDLTAAAIVLDPVLDILDGPFGTVEFLQVVGLTADELELCRAWNTEAVVDLLARDDPSLVSRLERTSLLEDPAAAGEIAARVASEGSELTELRVGRLSWRKGRLGRGVVLEMGSGTSAALGPALRRELVAPGASFSVVGDAVAVRFVAGGTSGWRSEGSELHIEVPAEDVAGLVALFDGRSGWGRRPGLPGLRVRVVP